MNAALKEVSGEYLTSLDIDDLMTKDCISKKVSWLKANPSYALVRSNGYFLFPNQEKRLFYAEDYKASEDVFLDILNGRIYNWVIIPELSEPPVRTLRATIPENESQIFR